MFSRRDSRNELEQEVTDLKEKNRALQAEIAQLKDALHRMNELQRNIEFITPQSDLFNLMNEIVAISAAVVHVENSFLMLLDEDSAELVFVEAQGRGREPLLGFHLPLGTGVASWVAATRNPKMVNDVRNEAQFSSLVDQKTGLQTKSLICVPLAAGNRTLGVIEVISTEQEKAFSDSDLDALLLFSRIATAALLKAEGTPAPEGP